MNVLLVNPSSKIVPLSLCSIYSYLTTRGHSSIKFCDLTHEDATRIKEYPSSIYVLNWELESQLTEIKDMLQSIDRTSSYIVAIGQYSIDHVEECLKYVDMCVMGDPEIPVAMLVESTLPEKIPGMALYSKGKLIGTTGHHGGKRLVFIEKLDELPFPNRKILNPLWNKSPMELITSRKSLDGTVRVRSIEDIMKEVKVLSKKFKVKEFVLAEPYCKDRDKKFKEEFGKLKLSYLYLIPLG